MNTPTYKAGIVSCGGYLPPVLDSLDDHESHPMYHTGEALGVDQKSAKLPDEDTVSIAVNAGLNALGSSTIKATDLRSVYLGTESPTYSVGNNAAAVADFLGAESDHMRTATLEFACRAGTLAFVQALHEAHIYQTPALAIGADVAKGAPEDILALTAGVGGASFLLAGENMKQDWIAEVRHITSYTARISDFWRATDEPYPRHAGRLSTAAYNQTLLAALDLFTASTGKTLAEFDHVVVHQPNAKLPSRLWKKLGLRAEQTKAGFLFPRTGNLYAGMVLAGLAHVLEHAEPNQDLLVASYGSGAGSDVIWIRTTPTVTSWQAGLVDPLAHQIHRRQPVTSTPSA